MSAASDLLSSYQHIISDLRLVPATGGLFEVNVDDDVLYSKLATGRHAEPGEVVGLFADLVGPDVPVYGT